MNDPHSLFRVAYRAAAQVLRSRVMAEEAGERALHQLTIAMLQGSTPHHPEAWLRVVARRSACAMLRSEWAKTPAMTDDYLVEYQAPFREPRTMGGDQVRERLKDSLSPRQRAAIDAALCCNTTRAAARLCGMQPRDFRRYLGVISRKARRVFADEIAIDTFADDVGVQFRLRD